MEILIKNPELEALARKILRGLATDQDLLAAKLDDIRAIKADTGERHFRTTSKPIERAAGSPERTQKYVASDESVDRMGDIIKVNGWDLTTFKENPQALWSHQAGAFPVGTVTEMQKGTRNGSKALIETIKYLDEGTSPTADILWKLVDQGVIRAVSVGFLPVKVNWPDSAEERDQLGLGPYGCVYEKQEQLELSNCTVPANANALSTKSIEDALRDMVKRGEISERDAESVVELGEKRSIQVQVLGMPEPAVEETPVVEEKAAPAVEEPEAIAPDWLFRINEKGCLEIVPPAPPEPEIVPEVESKDAAADQLIDIAELLVDMRNEIRALSEQVSAIVPAVEAVVGRSLRDPKRELRRALESAIEKVGGSFP